MVAARPRRCRSAEPEEKLRLVLQWLETARDIHALSDRALIWCAAHLIVLDRDEGRQIDRGAGEVGVIVKSGVLAIDSSGGLIDVCHFDSIVECHSSNHLGQIIESS